MNISFGLKPKLTSGGIGGVPPLVKTQRFADSFDRTGGALGANWTSILNGETLQVVSNQCWCAYNQNGAHRLNTVLANNQWAQVKEVLPSPGPEPKFLFARINNNAWGTTSGYALVWAAARFDLYRLDNGASIPLFTSTIAVAANDTVMVSMVGTKLSGYINDVEKITANDATYASGKTGMLICNVGGALTYCKLDDFAAGDWV